MSNKAYEPIYFNERWLSDGIGDAYKNWHIKTKPLYSATRVLIESATGTGKTSFILDKLLPYAATQGRHILYICNRTALNSQIKSILEQSSTNITNESLAEKTTIFQIANSESTITVLNYQSFLNFVNNSAWRFPYLYYVILDEAHFFIEDSLFNDKTWNIFDSILRNFSDSVLIFMSATLCEFKEMFDYFKHRAYPYHPQQTIFNAIYHDEIEIYYNTFRNSNYKVMHYNIKDELIYKIQKSQKSEKWLIFVRTKKDGKIFYDELRSLTDRKVQFLSADSKKSIAWKNLIENCKFNSDILIATKVIDNGININDSSVKHIVLPFCERIDFLQMFGRCRVSEHKNLCLYIERPDIRTLNAQIYHWIPVINAMNNFLKVKKSKNHATKDYKDRMDNLKKNFWNKRNGTINNLFYINKEMELELNPLAYYKIISLDLFYKKLIANTKNPDNYLNKVMEWLNMPKDATINHIYAENCSNFEEFITYFTDKPICKEDSELFYNSFQYYYKKYCYQIFSDNPIKYEDALSIRKGKTQRKATMNKSFAMVSLPYKIKKEQKSWVLRKL